MRSLLRRHIDRRSYKKAGFTVLELLVVLAIIGTLSVLGTPLFSKWGTKRSLSAATNEFYTELTNARLQAFSRGVSIRVNTSKNDDSYTISTYYLDSNLESCDDSLTWTLDNQKVIELNSNFIVTGSAIGDVCFYRDGTSTGGSFSLDQKNGQTDLGSADINITLATGFIDVIE